MQILEIVLYSHTGEKRVLPLRSGKANIITGSSASGKSALIQIVDYCLGRTSCHIPEGVIRDKVAWYGLRLQFRTGQVFVARQNPPGDQLSTSRAYFIEGEEIASPEIPPAQPNTFIAAIEDALTIKLGISPNLNVPQAGQTRPPLAANLRHALTYCFQEQGEIDSKDFLFHGQFDNWVAHAIKDTMPYFLGAIQEDRLAIEQELARARRDLKRAEQSLREAENIRGQGTSKAQSLHFEARQVGLLPDDTIPENVEELRRLLQSVTRWTPGAEVFQGAEKLTQLQEEIRRLQTEDGEVRDRIDTAKAFAREAEGYISEAREQELRLESIGLFEPETRRQQPHICPICTQGMAVPIPTAEAMHRSLAMLKNNLENTLRERPRLREYIESLEKEREEKQQRIREKAQDIQSLLEEQDAAQRIRELNVRRGRVMGRISLWLESVDLSDETSNLKEEVRIRQNRVAELEQMLESGEKEERLTSILNRIGVQMTEWAKFLELEHSNNPVRLDFTTMTAIVDRDRPIPLKNMGSGENWVGFHLITYLALQQHFISQNRPVPKFLFLDQPSKAYYPADQDDQQADSELNIKDEDRQAVSRMYKLIFDVVEKLAPHLQVVITDHADLAEERFQSAVIERWRGGKRLVPNEWKEKTNPKPEKEG